MSITDWKLAFLEFLQEIERYKDRKPPKSIYPPSHYITLIEFVVEQKLKKMGYRSRARKIAREIKQMLREMVYRYKKLDSAKLKAIAENDTLINTLIENVLVKHSSRIVKRSKREVLVYYFTFPDENQ